MGNTTEAAAARLLLKLAMLRTDRRSSCLTKKSYGIRLSMHLA
jgi:hypothetical protein